MSDLLVVSDKDPGGSTHLVSYLGKVNGLSSENFVSNQRLNKMIASGQVKDKAVAYFDDTIYSGSQHQPFYSQSHPFYSKLGSAQQNVVKSIGGSEGFGNVQGSLIWSYMYPDNNLTFFGSKFSGSVLRLPGP